MPAQAQEYPDKPIRVLVPFAPGGVVDTSTRILTNKMTERLGWQFVVDNRPGGNGFIAVRTAARGDARRLHAARRRNRRVRGESRRCSRTCPTTSSAISRRSHGERRADAGRGQRQSPINSFKDLIAGGEGEAGPGDLRLARHRLGQSPGDRMAGRSRRRSRCCTCRTRAARRRWRGGANEVMFTVAGMPGVTPHLKAEARQGARRHHGQAFAADAGVDDGAGEPASPAWMRRSGWACSRPRACRRMVVDKLYEDVAER